MNNYGVILDDFGFKKFLHDVGDYVVSPLAKKLWSGIGEDTLDNHHGFTIEYAENKDKHLTVH